MKGTFAICWIASLFVAGHCAEYFEFNCTREKVDVTLSNTTNKEGVLYVANNQAGCSETLNATYNHPLTVVFNDSRCNFTQNNQVFKVVFREFQGSVAFREVRADVKCYEGNEFRGTVNVTVAAIGVKEGGAAVTIGAKTFPPAKAPQVDLTFTQKGAAVTGSIAIGEPVQLKLNVSDGFHKVSPVSCTAVSSNPIASQPILQNYCPVTSLIEILKIAYVQNSTADQSEVSFTFNTFRLGKVLAAEQQLLFTCVVQVCGLNDAETSCDVRTTQASCAGVSGRRRRSLEDERGVVDVSQRLTVYDPEFKKADKTNTLSTSAVAVIGSSAGAVFILLAAFIIVLRVKRRKQRDEMNLNVVPEVKVKSIKDRFHSFDQGTEGQDNVAYDNM